MAKVDSSLYCPFLLSPRIPAELILRTIQHLPFGDGSLIAVLRYAHPRLWDLFRNYERSITAHFIQKELRHAQTDFLCDGVPNLDWLATCVKRYDVVDDIMGALFSESNCFGVERHNLSLANTGLLLLYRLETIGEHKGKIAYLRSLQRDPLIAIYLALHHATLTARYHGSGYIHQRTYGRFMDANQLSLRNELEFCFAEATLSIGPEFISNMLLHHDVSDAETTLLNFYHEYGSLEWIWPCWGSGAGEFEPPRTQGPQKEPKSRAKSLFTVLLERMADLMDCPMEEVRCRTEQRTGMKFHPLVYLDLEGKARLLQGLNMDEKGGLQRYQ